MPNDTQQAAAPEKKPVTPIEQFRNQIANQKTELAKILPSGIDADRFVRTVTTTVQMNEELLYADRRSLFGACMKAAQDGLLPDGREAVLNIYKTKVKLDNGADEWVPMVQYLPMVRGVLKIVRNAGGVAHIDAAAVYAMDHFVFQRGDDPKIEHKPYMGDEDPGQVVASYIIVRLDNGEVHREVMPRRDIEKTREASKSGNGANSPWTKWYDQMAIKAVIKRAAKLLPTSSEALDRVIQNDNDAMGFDFNQRGTTIDMEATPAQAAPKQLQQHASTRLRDIVSSKISDKVPVEQQVGGDNMEAAQ